MSVMMQEMSWQEFDKKRKDSILFLPIGSTEQHGPMLPLSVDCVISTGICKELAERVDGIVAPAICYGYKSAPLSGGGPLFPGTVDLNGSTLQNLVYDVLEEFIRDGVKKFFIQNGHYENEAFIIEAIDLLSQKHEDVTFIESSWWDVMSDSVIDKVFDEFEYPGIELEHAGVLETSLTMYFRPELVHMERFVEDGVEEELNFRIYPTSKIKVPKTGLLTTARTSSKEKGALLVQDIVDHYLDIIRERM